MTVTQTGDFTYEVAFYREEDALKLISDTENIEKKLETVWNYASAEASYIDSTTVELQVHIETECHVNRGCSDTRYEPPEPTSFDDMFSDDDVFSRLTDALSDSNYGFLDYNLETKEYSYDREESLLERVNDMEYSAYCDAHSEY